MGKKAAAKPEKKLPLRPVAAVLGTLVLAALAYCAILWLGQAASDAIADRPRYQVRFNDIDCPTPPGMDRATFLAEVRYLANPPLEFSSADPEMPQRLAAAFARHPWVARVTPNKAAMAWPHPIDIEFRTPALAVALAAGERVVDGEGILLPQSASSLNLPKLLTPQPNPVQEAGQRWDSPVVLRALDLAKDYDAATVEKTAEGWRIKQKNGRVLSVAR